MSGQWRGRYYNLGFRATEHLALQAHRESEKLLSQECTWERTTFGSGLSYPLDAFCYT